MTTPLREDVLSASQLVSTVPNVDAAIANPSELDRHIQTFRTFLLTIREQSDLLNAILDATEKSGLPNPLEGAEDIAESLAKFQTKIIDALRLKLAEALNKNIRSIREKLKQSLLDHLRANKPSNGTRLAAVVDEWATENDIDVVGRLNGSENGKLADLDEEVVATYEFAPNSYTVSLKIRGTVFDNLVCQVWKEVNIRRTSAVAERKKIV